MPRFHLTPGIRRAGFKRPPFGPAQVLCVVEGDSGFGSVEAGREMLRKIVGSLPGAADAINPWHETISILTLSGVIRNELAAKTPYVQHDSRYFMSFLETPGRDTPMYTMHVPPTPAEIADVLEYDRIIVVTDPDEFGAHIRGLVFAAICDRHPGLSRLPDFLYALRVPRYDAFGLPYKG